MKRLAKMVLAVIAALAFNANANEAININCEEVANHVAAYHDMIKKEPAAPTILFKAIDKNFEGKPAYARWFNYGLVNEAAVGVVFENNSEIKNRIANECKANKVAFAERIFNKGGAGAKNHAIVDLGNGFIDIVRIK
ncbi:hypothetical protein LI002_07825 [Escherichia coli]|jgi:hypothetical protein|uniref:hypothetical protein n=1 Tax=Escherichia coli TaxID=562 RepID=UPI00038FB60F|nr:hypothetical protein [Escherichia coli]DAZ01866.1 MAG TPA: hypothetical protein [Caudoviricetes sp.]EFG5515071.1 hypothetical protein [Escherichia coli]EFN3802796.1 hypothetical protein [Escherichia coli]EJX5538134.1 hypothetical protein [Escherichia coli]EQP56749.1 hypothetical protein G736_01631 [Escherichia coli HVH 70 (4-2963531)]